MTSIVFATVVVTLGDVCVVPFGVFCPFSTLTGFDVSTPLNVAIPPAEPVFVDKVQV